MNFSVSHPYWVMLDKISSPFCKIWSFLKLEEMIIQHISKIDELVINEGALSQSDPPACIKCSLRIPK